MEIRKIQQADFAEVLAMMEVFYASDALLIHPDPATLRRTLTDCIADGPYLEGFVFEENGFLAGYAMVAHSYSTEAGGRCVWIEDIYIRPEFRGKGLGSSFLAFAEERFSGQAVRIRLEAEPENERAMAVYRKAGFAILGYTQLVRELGERKG